MSVVASNMMVTTSARVHAHVTCTCHMHMHMHMHITTQQSYMVYRVHKPLLRLSAHVHMCMVHASAPCAQHV